MKPVMKLKREVILRIRNLARDLHDVYHDAYADKPQSLDLAKDEGISERMKEYFSDPIQIQLEKMISDLPKDERAEVVALVDWGYLVRASKIGTRYSIMQNKQMERGRHEIWLGEVLWPILLTKA